MADDESRGVHLSDKELVFGFMAATVAAVVVFLFGVFVGRGVHQARGPIADGGPSAAVDVVPDDVAADGAPPAGSGEAGSATLSYAERLGKTPPAETLKVAPETQRPRVEVPPEVPGEPLGPPPVASAVPATAAAAAPADPAPGLYTVQVAAMTRRDEADAIARQLKAKGYDAYVFVPEGSEGRGGFRVRIGAYKDKRQADLLAERLLREEKRYKPWVTR